MIRPAYLQSRKGSCDCCGKTKTLRFVVWAGMDTWACDPCRGSETDDDDDNFDADVIFEAEDPAGAPHNEHEWTRHYYLEGLRLARQRNMHVAEPLRSIINSFSAGVGR